MASILSLYPRSIGGVPVAPDSIRSDSVLSDGPGTVASGGGASVFNFSARTAVGDGGEVPNNDFGVVVELQMMWEDGSTVSPVSVADIGGASTIQIGIRPVGSIVPPFFAEADNISSSTGISDTLADGMASASPLPIVHNTSAANLVVEVAAGVPARIWIMPISGETDWDAIFDVDNFEFELHVTNNHPTDQLRVVFAVSVVAGSDPVADLAFPWLHVSDIGGPITNLVDGAGSLRVTNYGTGPAGTLAVPARVVFNPTDRIALSGLADVLAPGTSSDLGLTTLNRVPFNGQVNLIIHPEGSLSGQLDPLVPGNTGHQDRTPGASTTVAGPAEHQASVNVALLIQDIEISLVLDISGSMGWAGPGSLTRKQDLQAALVATNSMLISHAENFTSVAMTAFPFPDTPPWELAEERVPLQAINTGGALIIADYGALPPGGNTPLKAGVDVGLQSFSGGQVQRNLLVFSDGFGNVGDPPENSGDSIADAGVRVLAVRFFAATPSDEQMANLVGAVNAGNLNPNVPDSQLAVVTGADAATLGSVSKSFTTMIGFHVLGLSSDSDPSAIVSLEQPMNVHEFRVFETDQGVWLNVRWNEVDPELLDIEIRTPLCERIAPDTIPTGAVVETHDTQQIYFFGKDFIENVSGMRPRYGSWSLFVRLPAGSPQSPESEEEQYSYEIWTDSSIKLNAGLKPDLNQTGGAIVVEAEVFHAGQAFAGAAAGLTVIRPLNSRSQYLASATVSKTLLEAARLELEAIGEDNPWDIKARALSNDGRPFAQLTKKETYSMGQVGSKLTATAGLATVDGQYDFRVKSFGDLREGNLFRREAAFTAQATPRPDPENTTVYLEHDPSTGTDTVCVLPRDQFRNPILFDPRFEAPLVMLLANGVFVDELTLDERLNGTYCRSALFDEEERPRVDILVPGNSTPIDTVNLASPDGLVWVDTAVEFTQGLGSDNENTDPIEILGEFESIDGLLSLGSEGSVVVAAALARNPTEVCVFVKIEERPRAYSVEVCVGNLQAALSDPSSCQWVEVGQSEGFPECFSLTEVVGSVTMVRIADKSRNVFSTPIAPGSSLFAVGFVAETAGNVSVDDLAVCATESLYIGQGVRLFELDYSKSPVANSGSGTTHLVGSPPNQTTVVGDVFSVGNVLLDNVTVSGNLMTSGSLTTQNGGGVSGTTDEGVPLSLPNLQAFADLCNFPPTPCTNHKTLDGYTSLPPGKYGNVILNSGATLVLGSSGKYHFESLIVNSNSTLDISGAPCIVEICVRNGVTYRGLVNAAYGKANLLIVSLCTGDFLIEDRFKGTAVAVNGTLKFQGNPYAPHKGQFCGKRVSIQPGWTFFRVPRA